jgi:hypothetical protein
MRHHNHDAKISMAACWTARVEEALDSSRRRSRHAHTRTATGASANAAAHLSAVKGWSGALCARPGSCQVMAASGRVASATPSTVALAVNAPAPAGGRKKSAPPPLPARAEAHVSGRADARARVQTVTCKDWQRSDAGAVPVRGDRASVKSEG